MVDARDPGRIASLLGYIGEEALGDVLTEAAMAKIGPVRQVWCEGTESFAHADVGKPVRSANDTDPAGAARS